MHLTNRILYAVLMRVPFQFTYSGRFDLTNIFLDIGIGMIQRTAVLYSFVETLMITNVFFFNSVGTKPTESLIVGKMEIKIIHKHFTYNCEFK